MPKIIVYNNDIDRIETYTCCKDDLNTLGYATGGFDGIFFFIF